MNIELKIMRDIPTIIFNCVYFHRSNVFLQVWHFDLFICIYRKKILDGSMPVIYFSNFITAVFILCFSSHLQTSTLIDAAVARVHEPSLQTFIRIPTTLYQLPYCINIVHLSILVGHTVLQHIILVNGYLIRSDILRCKLFRFR